MAQDKIPGPRFFAEKYQKGLLFRQALPISGSVTGRLLHNLGRTDQGRLYIGLELDLCTGHFAESEAADGGNITGRQIVQRQSDDIAVTLLTGTRIQTVFDGVVLLFHHIFHDIVVRTHGVHPFPIFEYFITALGRCKESLRRPLFVAL